MLDGGFRFAQPTLRIFAARHDDVRNRSRDAPLRPSLANHDAKKGSPPLPQKRERSAERRIVQPMSADRRQVYTADKCTQSAYKTCLRNLSATRLRNLFAEARPPFGAHACGTRHRLLPRWLSPRTGFPEDSSSQVFCPLASSLRLSTLRADRSLCRPTGDPGPPGCGLAIPRAGTAPRSAFQACLPERRPR